jgi:hypothetical protein
MQPKSQPAQPSREPPDYMTLRLHNRFLANAACLTTQDIIPPRNSTNPRCTPEDIYEQFERITQEIPFANRHLDHGR